jgi:hypothetical protein
MAMNKILIHAPSLPGTGVFNVEARDSYFQPFIYLRKKLRSLGYTLEMSDGHSLRDCSWIWFFDADSVGIKKGLAQCKSVVKTALKMPQSRDLYRECLAAGMDKQIVLFLLEPPSVSPANWEPELHKLFSLIFTWHDNYVDGRKFIKIHVPQPHQFPCVSNITFLDKKLLVNISMNKFSRHPRELYPARRAAIRYFEQNQPENFDLYGVGWNRPVNILEKLLPITRQIYTSYRGTVKNKWDVLTQYRFSLCYENMRDEPGYVTEKIFDSMRAGCVPVYWGAPNITDYVDIDAFIDRRNFKTNEELAKYLSGINEQEYQQYQNAIQRYLASERFEKFLPSNFADTIINALKL